MKPSRVDLQKKHENHRNLYMILHGNLKVIESYVEVYGKMQAMKRP